MIFNSDFQEFLLKLFSFATTCLHFAPEEATARWTMSWTSLWGVDSCWTARCCYPCIWCEVYSNCTDKIGTSGISQSYLLPWVGWGLESLSSSGKPIMGLSDINYITLFHYQYYISLLLCYSCRQISRLNLLAGIDCVNWCIFSQ